MSARIHTLEADSGCFFLKCKVRMPSDLLNTTLYFLFLMKQMEPKRTLKDNIRKMFALSPFKCTS